MIRREKLESALKSLDHFPETVQFNIAKQDPNFKTKVGAFFSLVMYVAVIGFSIQRFVSLITRADADTQITELNDFYDFTHEFDGGKQVGFALGIGSLSLETYVDYSQFGQFRAFYFDWDLAGDGINFSNPSVPLRQCTLDDFGLGNSTMPGVFYQ